MNCGPTLVIISVLRQSIVSSSPITPASERLGRICLRDQIDMLYEVSADALTSLTGAKTVSVSSFTRPYQYVIAFNQRSPALRSPNVRRAMNAAIDREAFVRDGLEDEGNRHPVQSGRVIGPSLRIFPDFDYAPADALRELAKHARVVKDSGRTGVVLRFKCLIPGDQERLGLLVKRQLEMVGVTDGHRRGIAGRDVSGSQRFVIRGCAFGHGQRTQSFQDLPVVAFRGFVQPRVRLAAVHSIGPLDRIRYAKSDDEYRAAVAGFQRAVVDNPPGIFLAWSERARAVSRRFDVAAEPGRDILTTLRSWRPANDLQSVGRN